MTAPALAPATSLDTGEQFEIVSSPQRADLRVLRSDAGKVALARHLLAASDLVVGEDPLGGILLERWARQVEACRVGYRTLERGCGSWVFSPQRCDVRLCPDCERARSGRLVNRYDTVAGEMVSPKHWVFGLPNVAPGELHESLGVLLDAMAHLRHRALFAGGPCGGAHRAVAYDDVDTGEHHASGDEVEPCSHPRHRRELAAVGSCRCARCLEVDIQRAGERVTVNGCPRCVHDPVRGGIYSIEVTWSPTRPQGHPQGYKETADWHPHVHVLMDAPWIVQSEVRDAWQECTCDAIRRAEGRRAGSSERIAPCRHLRGWVPTGQCQHCGIAVGETDIWCGSRCRHKSLRAAGCRGASVVNVRAVDGAPGTPERRKAVMEVLKYVSKGLIDKDGHLLPGAGPLELAELLLAIRGRRLVAGWGSFRNVHDDDELERDTVPVWTGDIDEHGQDVILRLPRVCPCCGQEAQWGGPRKARRIFVHRRDDGVLVWLPPGSPAGRETGQFSPRDSRDPSVGIPQVDPLAFHRAMVAYRFRDAYRDDS